MHRGRFPALVVTGRVAAGAAPAVAGSRVSASHPFWTSLAKPGRWRWPVRATTLGRSGRCGRRSGSACGGVMRPTALQQQRLVGKSNGESVPSALAQQLRRQHPRWRGGRRLLALAVAAERAGAKATGAGAGAGAGADATQAHLDRGFHDRGLHRERHRHHRLRGCCALAPHGVFCLFSHRTLGRGVANRSSCVSSSAPRGALDEKRAALLAMYSSVQTGQPLLHSRLWGLHSARARGALRCLSGFE